MILRALLAVAMLLLLPLVGVEPASAHTRSLSVKPANGSRMATVPKEISIRTSEKVKTAYIAVTKPDLSLQELKPTIKKNTVTARMPAVRIKGEYEVAYRLVAQDGHVAPGTFKFTVTTGDEPQLAEPTPLPPSQKGLIWTLAIAAFTAMIGLALYAMTRTRP